MSSNEEPGPGGVILAVETSGGGKDWLRFSDPVERVEARELSEVTAAIERVEQAVSEGLCAAGFVSYEAAPAFDPALSANPAGTLPLFHFALYEERHTLSAPVSAADATCPAPAFAPSVSEDAYREALQRIKEYIAAGDTYQVNYSFRLQAPAPVDPWTWFTALCGPGSSGLPGFVDTETHAVLSLSPELFFRLDGNRITCRPMKGTASRGLTFIDDLRQKKWLGSSAKNQAENVMIVDMIRNDLGRIAVPGSVATERLFDVEQYDTLHQMTSTVSARTEAGLKELLGALFPSASVTGAPKVRTSEIIAELENEPRGIYTGCIGCLLPGRRAHFNVAIRTLEIDKQTNKATYGTGSGVVWDSDPEQEYEECRTKALALGQRPAPFHLLETLRWSPRDGFFLLGDHLERLCESASYFRFAFDEDNVRATLGQAARAFAPRPHRVRLLLQRNGRSTVEAAPLAERAGKRRWRVVLAREAVDPNDPFLYHKSTHRSVYDRARDARPAVDDVILWNPSGEITESCWANVVARIEGHLVTPPVACGLLAGTYRKHLLREGRITERVIHRDDLARADRLYLINSVRGWIPARLVP